MDQYPICLMDDDGRTALIVAAIHLNDNAAVRSAQKIANRRKFEVWKGMECIYGTRDAQLSPLSTSNLSHSL